MAQGDLTIFDEAILAIHNGVHDFDTDVLKVAFIDNTTVPAANDLTPVLSDYTAVSGGNFPATPETVAGTLANVTGTTTFDITTNISYAKNASNPTNVFYALLYNSSKSDQAIAFIEIDATGADGTAGLISLTWGANIWTSTET